MSDAVYWPLLGSAIVVFLAWLLFWPFVSRRRDLRKEAAYLAERDLGRRNDILCEIARITERDPGNLDFRQIRDALWQIDEIEPTGHAVNLRHEVTPGAVMIGEASPTLREVDALMGIWKPVTDEEFFAAHLVAQPHGIADAVAVEQDRIAAEAGREDAAARAEKEIRNDDGALLTLDDLEMAWQAAARTAYRYAGGSWSDDATSEHVGDAAVKAYRDLLLLRGQVAKGVVPQLVVPLRLVDRAVG